MPESKEATQLPAADNAAAARIATLALIPSAVAFNVAIGTLVRTVQLPIYLDCIGGIVTTLIAGLWPGVAVACLSQLIGTLAAPDLILYVGTAVAMSLCAHVAGKAGGFKTLPRALISGIGLGIVSAMASFGITAWRGGVTTAGSSFVTLFYLHHGFPLITATILSGLTCDPIDKIAECLMTVWLIRSVPVDLLKRFRGGTLDRNFGVPSPHPTSAMDLPFMIGGGLIGLIAGVAWFIHFVNSSGAMKDSPGLLSFLQHTFAQAMTGSVDAAVVFVHLIVFCAIGIVVGVLAGSAIYSLSFGKSRRQLAGT